jgi:hypothetical protein
MKLSSTFLILSFLFLSSLSAQTNDSIYSQYLHNNNNVPKRVYYGRGSENILKTDLTSIFDGNIRLIWEHRFNDYFALDSGLGMILPYSLADILKRSDGTILGVLGMNPQFINRNLGSSFHIEPKLFFDQSSYKYISVYYNFMKYSKLLCHEFSVAYGYNIDLKKTTYQTSIALSYINQIPNSMGDITDIKYKGYILGESYSDDLTSVGTIRLSIRIQFGYIFQTPLKPLKSNNN